MKQKERQECGILSQFTLSTLPHDAKRRPFAFLCITIEDGAAMRSPFDLATPLTFHSLDEQAQRSGVTQFYEFTRGKDRFIWMFFPNGLQCLAPIRKLPAVKVAVVVRRGHIHDQIPSASHALEHLLIKDVLVEGPHPLLKPFLKYGLEFNAMTTWEHTTYWTRSTHRAWKGLLDALLRMVFLEPRIDDQHWNKERPAIHQELRSRPEERRVHDALLKALYPDRPRFGVPSVGLASDIDRLTATDLAEAYDASYQPTNSLVLVEGLADPREILSIVTPIAERRTESRMTSAPFTDPGVQTPLTIPFVGGKSAERVLRRSNLFEVADAQREHLRVLHHTVQGITRHVLREEFRRKRGLTYGSRIELNEVLPGWRQYTTTMQMQRDRMEDAVTAWNDIWPSICKEIPRPSPVLRGFIENVLGDHRLSGADAQRLRWQSYTEALTWQWLHQDTRQALRPIEEYPVSTLRKALKDTAALASLASLEWQPIRIHAETAAT